MIQKSYIFLFFFLFGIVQSILPQNKLSSIRYSNPQEYTIAGVTVTGVKYLDKNVLVQLAGFREGQKIVVPGDKITKAINKLWKHGLFSDIKIYATKIEEDRIYLEIYLQERSRLAGLSFNGLRKSEVDDIKEKINLPRGSQVTDNILNNTKIIIKKHFIEKGFLNTKVKIVQKPDTVFQNTVNLSIFVDKQKKVKINDIVIEGNNILSEAAIRRKLKNTKRKTWYNIFKRSKYIEDDWIEDKETLLAKYHSLGYRDATIVIDSVYDFGQNTIEIKLKINEGNKYFFRNIKWVGNTKYNTEQLSTILKIKKGDVYDQEVLNNRLTIDQDAISTLYMDEGYLRFYCIPVETNIENDSIDLELRIYEGKQHTINKIIIRGNTKTNEHIVRRELYTRPGELFSKSDLIRSVRELAQLGHFDPEKIVPTPLPDPVESTVDIEYSLEERANDQVEISGGWGQNMIIGTVALTFNNFSTRNILNKEAWQPLPTGDGQSLSLRAQATGPRYQLYSVTFMEPWLGGKKPVSFSVSLYHSMRSDGKPVSDHTRGTMKINGVSVGLGRRIKWPDDNFVLRHDISLQSYNLDNWKYYFIFSDGKSNNLSLSTTFARNSIDNPLYTRRGSKFSLGLQLTPPYSLLKKEKFWELTELEKLTTTESQQTSIEESRRYKWIEYHKWSFDADWYAPLWKDLVLRTRIQFGYLGYYNKELGYSPFEGYYVGGDGMSGYNMYGSETVGLRGYPNNSFNNRHPGVYNSTSGTLPMNLYNKYTVEIRYPITLSESATIYGLAFLEGGNTWMEFENFNPFSIKRSAGFGVRIFLPMLGLMGIDWGYGFDQLPPNRPGNMPIGRKGEFHFVLGQQF